MDDISADPKPQVTRRSLRRPHQDRYVAGVAAGIARYFDVDVTIVRVLFGVLTLFGAAGLGLYAVGWLLIPEEGESRSVAETFADRHRSGDGHPGRGGQWLALVGVVAAVALFAGLLGVGWWGPLHVGGGGVVLLAAAVGLYVVWRRHPDVLPRLGLLAGAAAVAVAALALAAVMAATSVVLASGVPLFAGAGTRTWTPATITTPAASYRLGAGDAELDLRQAQLPAGTSTINSSVAVGHLLVDVPSGITVVVHASSEVGDVEVFGGRSEGVDVSRTVTARASNATVLHLNAKAGIGDVVVRQDAPSAV